MTQARPESKVSTDTRSKKNATTRARVTPGHKALLIPDAVFVSLQEIQLGLPHPRRLTVGDLAAASITLAVEQHLDEIVAKAKLLLRQSL